jgi:beta-galactosidase GanA
MDRIGFGAAYYPEYQRHPDLRADFDLMAKAGFSVIRVGESVWSTWEPEDGRFELDWLEPVLDAAREREIGVILGTPTYAVPMWLARRYPEVAAEAASGHRVGWGARQEVNFTHAAYRFHAERVIRQVVGRYRDHPAVIGYQVDNEPGLRLLYNADVFEMFTDWLRRRYGTVGRLNEEWGLAYWSHRLSRWSDLWRPAGNFQPQYDLAWRRFQAGLVTDFIGWQAGIVRDVTGGRGLVTTCISYEQPGVEDVELSRALDVASGNAYYGMQDSLAHPNAAPRATGPMGWVVRGPWAVTQLADLMYSSKQAPFLVTETNAGSIGFSSMNESPYDGQWRQRAPARITDAAGTWYEEMASLPSPVPVQGVLGGAATGFAEGLDASGAEVLARYQHPHLSRWAAVTTRPAGAGRVTVIGTVPDQALAAGLARWLVPRAAGGWTTDAPVTVATSTGPSGARLHVLHNWGWQEATACPSSPVTDMPGGSRYTPAEPVTLGAWDVRLFYGDEGP